MCSFPRGTSPSGSGPCGGDRVRTRCEAGPLCCCPRSLVLIPWISWMSLLGQQGQELPLRAPAARVAVLCPEHLWRDEALPMQVLLVPPLGHRRGFGGKCGAVHSDRCQAVQSHGVTRCPPHPARAVSLLPEPCGQRGWGCAGSTPQGDAAAFAARSSGLTPFLSFPVRSMRCLARSTSTPTSPRSICPSWTPATWTLPAASASCSGAGSTRRPTPASTAPTTPSSSRYPHPRGWRQGEKQGGRREHTQLLISPPQLISAPLIGAPALNGASGVGLTRSWRRSRGGC